MSSQQRTDAAGAGFSPLAVLCGSPLETGRFLILALKIAEALAELHRQGLIHGNINPNCILWNEESAAVTLTCLRGRSELAFEVAGAETFAEGEVSLAYMSPEQTGRVNRPVDQSSDLYSLGVVLYQLLTGTLPCHGADLLEWVHCHIARPPLPPAELTPQIPLPLSDIVMKLLSKDPEDRYQTAAGLAADLGRCFSQWRQTGAVAPFALGKEDISERLLIPRRLYGREKERAFLLEAFRRVTLRGTAEAVLVSGYAGIGKTRLVWELYRPVLGESGFFLSGKADRLKGQVPYETVAEAFRGLVRQILMESEERIARWKRQFQEAVGENGQVIVEIIPQLELILGPQPPVQPLPPAETQNRFHLLFGKLVALFAQSEHPLVVFLDDLQWADLATLRLIEYLVTRLESASLLLVGAYRENEVGAGHPLLLSLKRLKESGAAVSELSLAPLSRGEVEPLILDMLRTGDQARCAPLAELVVEKTRGNPFFIIQFLTMLYREGLLTFDRGRRSWIWDLERIRRKGYTDNVIDLMVAKLKSLPEATLKGVTLASCLGNTVDRETLSMVSGLSGEVAGGILSEAVQEGLLGYADGSYSFLHDRIQEAAYSLVPGSERAVVHLSVGRLLLSQLPPASMEERVFEVVNQLNRGAVLISEPGERDALRGLNLAAGRKAKAAVAYESAADYLEKAAALLRGDAWDASYDETFSLFLDLAECYYLTGRFADADALFSEISFKCRSSLDRARVLRLRGRLYQVTGHFGEALQQILQALRLFGIDLPDRDDALLRAYATESAALRTALSAVEVPLLAQAPQATDPEGAMIVSLLVEGLGPSYAAAPPYFPILAAKAVRCALRYGNSFDSCFAYNAYAVVLIAIDCDIDAGTAFSEMALALAEKIGDQRAHGLVLAGHAGLVMPWRHNIARSVPLLEESVAELFSAGDFLNCTHALVLLAWAIIEKGETLDEVVRCAERHRGLAWNIHNETIFRTLGLVLQLVAALKGTTREPGSFDDDSFREEECIETFSRASWQVGLAYLHVMKLIACVVYGRFEDALQEALRAEPVLRLMMAMPVAGTLCFFQALTLAALHPRQSSKEREEAAPILAQLVAKLKYRAESSPEYYENRYALVAAEIACNEGREAEAQRLFEVAIGSARRNGFRLNEALALERAAEFYAASGLERLARNTLRDCRGAYARLGADGKVGQLEELYPWLQIEDGAGRGPMRGIDAISLAKASQAISGEIVLERLLETLMRITLENAGAQKGCLLLAQGEELAVRMEAGFEAGGIATRHPAAAPPSEIIPESIVNYVKRTRESVILDDAANAGPFSADPYLVLNRPLSVLCLPIVRQADLVGLLYLENSVVKGAFTAERVAVLEALAGQMAISLDNALLYQGLQQEVRERKVAEEQFRDLLETAPDAMVIVDEEGTIRIVNSLTERLFGYHREELIGQKVEMLVPERFREGHVGRRASYVQNPRVRVLGARDLRGRRRNGEEFPADISLSPLHTDRGLLVTAIVRDVTERKLAEKALQESEQKYRQLSETLELRVNEAVEELDRQHRLLALQSRQALMGEMISNIAHQWRQPLNSLGLIVQELQVMHRRGEISSGYIEATVKKGMEIIRYLSRTIDDFRFFFEPGKEKVPFKVFDVLEKTLSLLQASFGAVNIRTRVEPAADLEINGYPNEFSQVLLNLLMNAKDAFLARKIAEPLITIRMSREGGRAVITVTDNAGGIADGVIDRIFDPYFTTKGPEQGTGIGLFMCKTIIEKSMNGTLTVRNVSGGAEFRIEISVDAEPHAAATQKG